MFDNPALKTLQREYCRECRDELPYGSKLPVAEFILWGKLFPREAFGPKCYDHAVKYFPVERIDQWAVYDLRPINSLLDTLDSLG